MTLQRWTRQATSYYAMQWTGANVTAISDWAVAVSLGIQGARSPLLDMRFDYTVRPPQLTITTHQGSRLVRAGEYVVRSIRGLGVVSAEEFARTFELEAELV